MTASHVVAGASSITVKFQNGPVRTASVRGPDTSTDVSVLHVNPSGLTRHPLPMATSSRWSSAIRSRCSATRSDTTGA